MCTGRVDLAFMLRTFSNGKGGVFIGGCWPGECHYVTEGNYHALGLMHLARKLLQKTGVKPVMRADLASVIYHGDRVSEAPDMLVGYNAGYGNADLASEGWITHEVLADNTGGTFNGSHLMAPEVVAGILLSNRPVREGSHDLKDLTVELLSRYGVEPNPDQTGHRVLE